MENELSEKKTKSFVNRHMKDDNIFMPVVRVPQLCVCFLCCIFSLIRTDSYWFHPAIKIKSIRKEKRQYLNEEYSPYSNKIIIRIYGSLNLLIMDQTLRHTLSSFDIDIKYIQSIFFPKDFSDF